MEFYFKIYCFLVLLTSGLQYFQKSDFLKFSSASMTLLLKFSNGFVFPVPWDGLPVEDVRLYVLVLTYSPASSLPL